MACWSRFPKWTTEDFKWSLNLHSIPLFARSSCFAMWKRCELCSNALEGMHPTFKHVPPNVGSFSTHTVYKTSIHWKLSVKSFRVSTTASKVCSHRAKGLFDACRLFFDLFIVFWIFSLSLQLSLGVKRPWETMFKGKLTQSHSVNTDYVCIHIKCLRLWSGKYTGSTEYKGQWIQ